jgi:3-mercaptopyruvate sulfurtransferase SseA
MSKTWHASLLFILVSFWLMGEVIAAGSDVTESKWWARMEQAAKKSGYNLVSTLKAQKWYVDHQVFTVIDVRPDYEYEEGHLKNALNVEFDLGARNKISGDTKKQFLNALGEDKSVKVLIYCRSYS